MTAATEKPSDQRAERRHGCCEYSSLSIGGVLETPCVVIETSAGGASVRLRAPMAVRAGMPVNIVIGNDERRGVIAWRDGDRVGIRFIGQD